MNCTPTFYNVQQANSLQQAAYIHFGLALVKSYDEQQSENPSATTAFAGNYCTAWWWSSENFRSTSRSDETFFSLSYTKATNYNFHWSHLILSLNFPSSYTLAELGWYVSLLIWFPITERQSHQLLRSKPFGLPYGNYVYRYMYTLIIISHFGSPVSAYLRLALKARKGKLFTVDPSSSHTTAATRTEKTLTELSLRWRSQLVWVIILEENGKHKKMETLENFYIMRGKLARTKERHFSSAGKVCLYPLTHIGDDEDDDVVVFPKTASVTILHINN